MTAVLDIFPSPIDPGYLAVSAGTYQGTFAINSSTVAQAVAGIFTAQATDTITDLLFYQSTMGTVHTNGYKIGIEGVNTSGNPDGTYLASGNGFAEFTPSSGDNGKCVAVSLGANTISLAAGQLIAITIRVGSGYVAADSLTVGIGTNANSVGRNAFPVSQTNTSGTWSKNAQFESPVFGMRSSGNCYGWPWGTIAASAFSNTNERGMLFNIPSSYCSTYQVRGVRFFTDAQGSSTSNYRIANIYSGPGSSNPTILQSSNNIIYNYYSATGSGIRVATYNFTSLSTLTSGTDYVVGLSSSTAASENIYYLTNLQQSDFDAWPGQRNTQFVTRALSAFPPTNTGNAFTATATQRPIIELLLSDLTPPSGGGGSGMIVHPGMAGGMRG